MVNRQLLTDRFDTVRSITINLPNDEDAMGLAKLMVQAELDELAVESLQFWTENPVGEGEGVNVPACMTEGFEEVMRRVMDARGRGRGRKGRGKGRGERG